MSVAGILFQHWIYKLTPYSGIITTETTYPQRISVRVDLIILSYMLKMINGQKFETVENIYLI